MYRMDLWIRSDNLRMTRIPFTMCGRYQSHAINYDDKIYHLSKQLEGIYPLLRKADVIISDESNLDSGKRDVSSQAYRNPNLVKPVKYLQTYNDFPSITYRGG